MRSARGIFKALFLVFTIKYAISYIHVSIACDSTVLFLCYMKIKTNKQTNTKQVVNYW